MARNENNNVLFIITQDENGNDRMFAGCKNFEAEWTLQPAKARTFTDFQLALEISRQFPGEHTRIHTADRDLGPRVVTTGSPLFQHKIV